MGCGLSKARTIPEVLVSHRSSRTTFQSRLLIVGRYRSGWPQAHIAAAMGISRKCVKTWLDRYAAEGEAGLEDRSSRPLRSPNRTPVEVEDQIVALRRAERRGRDAISARAGVSPRTVSRVLARRGLPHLSMLDPMTGLLIRSSKATAVRYERARPGRSRDGRAANEGQASTLCVDPSAGSVGFSELAPLPSVSASSATTGCSDSLPRSSTLVICTRIF